MATIDALYGYHHQRCAKRIEFIKPVVKNAILSEMEQSFEFCSTFGPSLDKHYTDSAVLNVVDGVDRLCLQGLDDTKEKLRKRLVECQLLAKQVLEVERDPALPPIILDPAFYIHRLNRHSTKHLPNVMQHFRIRIEEKLKTISAQLRPKMMEFVKTRPNPCDTKRLTAVVNPFVTKAICNFLKNQWSLPEQFKILPCHPLVEKSQTVLPIPGAS